MQSHTDTAASHGELSHSCLEECTAEVATNEIVSLLQESVGVIRVAQVCGSTDHVGHLLSQLTQNSCRSTTSSAASLLLHLAPVDLRSLAAEPLLELLCLYGMTLSPLSLLSIALSNDLLQLLSTLCVKLLHLGEDLERILRISPQVLHRVDVSIASERSTVSCAVALIRRAVSLLGTLTHHTVTDDQ